MQSKKTIVAKPNLIIGFANKVLQSLNKHIKEFYKGVVKKIAK